MYLHTCTGGGLGGGFRPPAQAGEKCIRWVEIKNKNTPFVKKRYKKKQTRTNLAWKEQNFKSLSNQRKSDHNWSKGVRRISQI